MQGVKSGRNHSSYFCCFSCSTWHHSEHTVSKTQLPQLFVLIEEIKLFYSTYFNALLIGWNKKPFVLLPLGPYHCSMNLLYFQLPGYAALCQRASFQTAGRHSGFSTVDWRIQETNLWQPSTSDPQGLVYINPALLPSVSQLWVFNTGSQNSPVYLSSSWPQW